MTPASVQKEKSHLQCLPNTLWIPLNNFVILVILNQSHYGFIYSIRVTVEKESVLKFVVFFYMGCSWCLFINCSFHKMKEKYNLGHQFL